MSLINDALKRATQTLSSSAAAPPPEPQSPMQPVDYRRGELPWFFLPSVLLVLAGACWFIFKGLESGRLPRGTMPVHAREPLPAPTPSIQEDPAVGMLAAGLTAPSSESSYVPTQQPNRNFSLEDPPAATPAPEPTAHATPPELPKPAYKLQGIFFRTANPSATVNGKNVTVGSRISGATVKSITREGVTLESDGQTTVLTLE